MNHHLPLNTAQTIKTLSTAKTINKLQGNYIKKTLKQTQNTIPEKPYAKA